MDQLERNLRDVLSSDRRALDPSLVSLERIHARATRRHRRRVALTASATGLTVLAAAGVGFAIGGQSGDDRLGPLGTSSPTGQVSQSPEPSSSPSAPSASPAVTGPAWDGARVISMTATSTRTIVVLGANGDTGTCTPPDCIRLAQSHDGGQTWEALPIPSNAIAIDDKTQSATQVRFGSASDGWVFGGGLWATHDGGYAWDPITMPGKVRRLEAAAGTAWALIATGGEPTEQLWSTPVGSDDWQPVSDVTITGPGDLAVQGKRVTVLGASDSPAWSNVSGNFKKVTNPCVSSLQVELSASGGLWAKCETGTSAYLATSPDGTAWTDVQFDTGGGAPPNSMVVGARSPSEALLWLGNGGTPLSHLTSSGTLTPVASPGTGITWMGFTTKDIGYAITCCSIQTLLRTDDGGDTWTDVGPG